MEVFFYTFSEKASTLKGKKSQKYFQGRKSTSIDEKTCANLTDIDKHIESLLYSFLPSTSASHSCRSYLSKREKWAVSVMAEE